MTKGVVYLGGLRVQSRPPNEFINVKSLTCREIGRYSMQTPNQPSPKIFLATPLDKTRYIITAIGYGLLNQSINQSNNQSIKSAFIDYLTKAKRGLPELEYKHKKGHVK